LQELGQAEIAHLGRAVLGEQHVGGLEVPVQDAALVGLVNGPRQGGHQAGGGGRWHRHAAEPPVQAAAACVLEGEVGPAVGLPHLENLHNVGVLDTVYDWLTKPRAEMKRKMAKGVTEK
jgi:hypothetical protein